LHEDAGPGGQSASVLVLAEAAKSPGELSLRYDLESEPLVVGRVPGDLGVGGQCEGGETALPRPGGGGVQERFSQTPPGVVGVHGNLLDMGVCVDDVDEKVGHRAIRIVGDDLGPAVLLVGGQFRERRRLVVRDGSHAEVVEHRAGSSLDVAKSREISTASGADHNASVRVSTGPMWSFLQPCLCRGGIPAARQVGQSHIRCRRRVLASGVVRIAFPPAVSRWAMPTAWRAPSRGSQKYVRGDSTRRS